MTLVFVGVYIKACYNIRAWDNYFFPLYGNKCLKCGKIRLLDSGYRLSHYEWEGLEEVPIDDARIQYRKYGNTRCYGIILLIEVTSFIQFKCSCPYPGTTPKLSRSMKKINKFFRQNIPCANPVEDISFSHLFEAIGTCGENILESEAIAAIIQADWDYHKSKAEVKKYPIDHDVLTRFENENRLLYNEIYDVLPCGFRDLVSYIVDYSSEISSFIKAVIQIRKNAEHVIPKVRMFFEKIRWQLSQ
ncbi:MAG: hypothetical protein Harvfovirus14_15 [Harvfovirus sp.]|uniref:Uncharacterized protein n=1 Tax=Harvfovirus sp. TaxID=2487768 RepID=A0A3G5A3I0_9VIRU|nr:MAG: hypothetical protein Harvfovirus14_15 [Harvfovirus sp.]